MVGVDKMNFKTLLVENKVFCPNCDSELHKGNLMFEDIRNNTVVCGYCRDDYEDIRNNTVRTSGGLS